MTAPERIAIAGASALVAGDPAAPLAVILLHGRQMEAADLAPFTQSIGVAAYFVVPDAPLVAEPRGRTWWPVDSEARLRRLTAGPMELSHMDPEGRAEARALLGGVIAAIASGSGEAGPRDVVLVGFSQGGMLAMDYVLHAAARPRALALLSSTRIAIADWQPRAGKLAGMPVLVAHGHGDAELAFHAGELLRDFAVAGGADVTWLPFDGAHDIPLVVWRALRRFLRALG